MANSEGQVANEITKEAAELKNISKDPPKSDSELVKGWQKTFHPKYLEALRLAATAKTLPGVNSGGVSLVSTGICYFGWAVLTSSVRLL
jgi:hypothetical protein